MSRKTVLISFVLIGFGFCTPFAKGPLARAATVSTITGLSISGGPIVGGSTQTAAGTVTISPANDVDVSISLSGANFQTNHPSGYLVIPAGSTSGNFTVVNTNFVTQNTTLTIGAAGRYADVAGTATAQLTVTPIMSSVSVGPSSVVGGSTTDVNGSVTLVAPPRLALGAVQGLQRGRGRAHQPDEWQHVGDAAGLFAAGAGGRAGRDAHVEQSVD